MRRALGLALAGLGAFLVVLALLVPGYVVGKLVKYPQNEYLSTTLQGTGMSYFSPSLLREVHGATIRVTSTVKGVAGTGTASTAVWDQFTYLYDETNHKPDSWSNLRFAFNRRSAELIQCCGANLNGDTSIRQSGLAEGLWPFGTQQRTYDVFDSTLNKPRPAKYEGTSTIDGIGVYRFVEQVPPTFAGTIQLPPSLLGMKGTGMMTLRQMYTGTNVFWVDPQTGAQLNTTQAEDLALVDDTGVQRGVLLDGTLRFTPQSISKVVALDRSGRNQLSLVAKTVPIAGGALGVVLLIAGILLSLLGSGERRSATGRRLTEPIVDRAAESPRSAEQQAGG